MGYRLLADAVAVSHLGFVLFALLGGLLVWRWPGWLWAHLPAVVWAVLIEWGGWICPLTPLENWLRHQAGQAGYSSGFVEHYLWPLLYPEDLTRAGQWWLGAGVAVLNLAVYGRLLWRRRNGRRCEGD